MSYPFIKCLNPRHIINPYTGQSMIVQCGHCASCLMRKSSINTMKCELESLSHKYTMFITLTYDNDHLPKMRAIADNMKKDDCGEIYDSGEAFKLIDDTLRLGIDGTFLGYTENYMSFIKLQNKVELPFMEFPRLCKYDAQLFIKRLRRNIDRKFEEIKKLNIFYGIQDIVETPKIRYYLVGEYGPKHFRPHYHLLLWFSNDVLFSSIRQILSESWKYGRIDCQKSQGHCSSYVAKYINSNMSLPEIFRFKQTRPFSIHSTHLGEKILEKPREEIYTSSYKSVVSTCIPRLNKDSDVVMWRSLKTYYFPKCKGYVTKSESERLYSYKLYETASRWFGKVQVVELSKLIYEYCLGVLTKNPHYLGCDLKLIDYFIKSCGIDLYHVYSNFQDADFYIRVIYMELLLSKHYITFCCQNDANLFYSIYKKVEKFWQDDDLYNLCNLYNEVEDFQYHNIYFNESDLQYLYYNDIFDLQSFKQTIFYKQYRQEKIAKYHDSIKHKYLNDANKIFIN